MRAKQPSGSVKRAPSGLALALALPRGGAGPRMPWRALPFLMLGRRRPPAAAEAAEAGRALRWPDARWLPWPPAAGVPAGRTPAGGAVAGESSPTGEPVAARDSATAAPAAVRPVAVARPRRLTPAADPDRRSRRQQRSLPRTVAEPGLRVRRQLRGRNVIEAAATAPAASPVATPAPGASRSLAVGQMDRVSNTVPPAVAPPGRSVARGGSVAVGVISRILQRRVSGKDPFSARPYFYTRLQGQGGALAGAAAIGARALRARRPASLADLGRGDSAGAGALLRPGLRPGLRALARPEPDSRCPAPEDGSRQPYGWTCGPRPLAGGEPGSRMTPSLLPGFWIPARPVSGPASRRAVARGGWLARGLPFRHRPAAPRLVGSVLRGARPDPRGPGGAGSERWDPGLAAGRLEARGAGAASRGRPPAAGPSPARKEAAGARGLETPAPGARQDGLPPSSGVPRLGSSSSVSGPPPAEGAAGPRSLLDIVATRVVNADSREAGWAVAGAVPAGSPVPALLPAAEPSQQWPTAPAFAPATVPAAALALGLGSAARPPAARPPVARPAAARSPAARSPSAGAERLPAWQRPGAAGAVRWLEAVTEGLGGLVSREVAAALDRRAPSAGAPSAGAPSAGAPSAGTPRPPRRARAPEVPGDPRAHRLRRQLRALEREDRFRLGRLNG